MGRQRSIAIAPPMDVGAADAVPLADLYKKQFQWSGLRENLQETIDFPMKYRVFL